MTTTLTPAQKLDKFHYRVAIPTAHAMDYRHEMRGVPKTGNKKQDAENAAMLTPKNLNVITMAQLFHDGCTVFEFLDRKKVVEAYEITVEWLNHVRKAHTSQFHVSTVPPEAIMMIDYFAAFLFTAVRKISPDYAIQGNVKPVMQDLYSRRIVRNRRYEQGRKNAMLTNEDGTRVQPEHKSVMDDIFEVLGNK